MFFSCLIIFVFAFIIFLFLDVKQKSKFSGLYQEMPKYQSMHMYSVIYVCLLFHSFQTNGLHLWRTLGVCVGSGRVGEQDSFQVSLGICLTNMFLPAFERNVYSTLEFLWILTISYVSHSNDDNTPNFPSLWCNNLPNTTGLPGHSDATSTFLASVWFFILFLGLQTWILIISSALCTNKHQKLKWGILPMAASSGDPLATSQNNSPGASQYLLVDILTDYFRKGFYTAVES